MLYFINKDIQLGYYEITVDYKLLTVTVTQTKAVTPAIRSTM